MREPLTPEIMKRDYPQAWVLVQVLSAVILLWIVWLVWLVVEHFGFHTALWHFFQRVFRLVVYIDRILSA